MEAGLMEIVQSLTRSWIYDTYFSFHRAIHPGGMSGYRSGLNVLCCTVSVNSYSATLIKCQWNRCKARCTCDWASYIFCYWKDDTAIFYKNN